MKKVRFLYLKNHGIVFYLLFASICFICIIIFLNNYIYSVKEYDHMATCGTSIIKLVKMYEIETLNWIY